MHGVFGKKGDSGPLKQGPPGVAGDRGERALAPAFCQYCWINTSK